MKQREGDGGQRRPVRRVDEEGEGKEVSPCQIATRTRRVDVRNLLI